MSFVQFGGVMEQKPCGCRVDSAKPDDPHVGTLTNPWVVRHCQMHGAVSDLLDAAKRVAGRGHASGCLGVHPMDKTCACLVAWARVVIARAEGREVGEP